MKPYIDKSISDVTSYDLLKSLAVIFMIIDHIGLFFFPDDLTWRAVANSMPVWLFLIGYANTRDITAKLIFIAAFVAFVNFMAGLGLFAMNILVSIILVRLVVNPVAKMIFRNRETLIAGIIVLTILYFPTSIFVEYGTLALLWALYGAVVRGFIDHNRTFNGLISNMFRHRLQVFLFGVLCLVIFYTIQMILFGFTGTDALIGIVSGYLVVLICLFFRPAVFKTGFGFLSPVLKFTGRYTLEIYALHLTVFAIISYWLQTGTVAFPALTLF
jgi:hypothetical protein